MRFLFVFAMLALSCSSKTTIIDAGQAHVVPVKVSETLDVTLLPAASFAAGSPIELRMRVKNSTGKPQKFCTYHTLFEGLRNDIFDVKNADGTKLDYRGMMAKRAPPGDDDFITLAPGEERTSNPVDISEGYAFSSGAFTVMFSGGAISELPASAPLIIIVK